MVLAAYLTTAFAVGAVGAWHLLRDRNNASARLMFSMAMWMALLVAPLQVAAGDLHGLNTVEHQPVKVAAMEGHYQTRRAAPLVLIGMPDSDAARVRWAVEIPRLGSFILTHDLNGQVTGLDAWPREDWPNVPLVFWSFRTMVGIGLLMVGVGLWSGALRLRGRLYHSRALLRIVVLLGPGGFVAVLAGWIVTEAGRQPYTVYGLLRTAQSVSAVDAPAVAASLLAFVVVYLGVFGAGVVYLLRLMKQHPVTEARVADEAPEGRPRLAVGVGQDLSRRPEKP
jgi:cytochrome d ubiquinol oxidase subunit I